jgi:sulfite reductase alpha subunit-like flavoprotein
MLQQVPCIRLCVLVPCLTSINTLPPCLARASPSSCSLHPGQAHLLVALVQYTTPYNRVKRGLCSTYLSALTPSQGGRVACWVEQGSLRMPGARNLPLLMIGPGTGKQTQLWSLSTHDSVVVLWGCFGDLATPSLAWHILHVG